MRTIERKYMGHDTGKLKRGWRNIIVLLPKIRTTITLQGQTRWICIQSTLDKWYCGCLALLLNMSLNAPCISDVGIQDGREEGQSADEISTTLNFLHRTGHA